jgi:asparagine synthase (glutamine-hydrolysing)
MSLFCDASARLADRAGALAKALASVLHDERYTARVLWRDDVHFLAFTGYPAYPLASRRVGDWVVHIEGQMYGPSRAAAERRVDVLAHLMTADGAEHELAARLLDSDGDFVICLRHRTTGAVSILTDVLGRLPLYYHRTPDAVVVSRELRFIASVMRERRFDRMALAQYLLTGHPLGSRTLLDSVQRLPGATLIRIGGDGRDVRVTALHRLDLEPKSRAGRDARDNAQELATRFVEACTVRAVPGHPVVIAMSGGFESRALAAGFHAAAVPFGCATFLDSAGQAAPDVPVAARIAQLFGSPWKLVRLDPPRRRDVLTLLRMKSGMNSLAMAFVLPFLERIAEEWGPALHLGHGQLGQTVTWNLAPSIHAERPGDMAAHILAQRQQLPLDLVARLTMLREAEIVGELEDLLHGYPEREPPQKLAHFALAELGLKWHSEGEDRDRCYVWSMTPFASPQCFFAAMDCPDDQKRHYGLFREFLLRLSPGAAAIEHAGIGTAITSRRFRIDAVVLSLLAQRPAAAAGLATTRAPHGAYRGDAAVVQLLRAQLASSSVLFDYLDRPTLEDMAHHCSAYPRDRMDLLFTITSAIEDLGGGRSVLESAERGAG